MEARSSSSAIAKVRAKLNCLLHHCQLLCSFQKLEIFEGYLFSARAMQCVTFPIRVQFMRCHAVEFAVTSNVIPIVHGFVIPEQDVCFWQTRKHSGKSLELFYLERAPCLLSPQWRERSVQLAAMM